MRTLSVVFTTVGRVNRTFVLVTLLKSFYPHFPMKLTCLNSQTKFSNAVESLFKSVTFIQTAVKSVSNKIIIFLTISSY